MCEENFRTVGVVLHLYLLYLKGWRFVRPCFWLSTFNHRRRICSRKLSAVCEGFYWPFSEEHFCYYADEERKNYLE